MTIEYQPKGGMCAGCKDRDVDCSSLDFSNMPVIERYGYVKIVRCDFYECGWSKGEYGKALESLSKALCELRETIGREIGIYRLIDWLSGKSNRK